MQRSNRTTAISRRQFCRATLGLAALPLLGRAAATPSAGPIRFRASTAAPGLDFVLRNDARGHKYQVETVPGGLAVIDFDNDGWPDLYCTNGAALPSLEKNSPAFFNRLYRNNRDGSFTDVTAHAGVAGTGYCMGVAVGDFDNDGRDDLYVVGVHGNTLYHNNGDGTFTDVTRQAGVGGFDRGGRKLWSVAAAWIDYDNDGRLDLLVSNYCDWSPGTDPVCGGLSGNQRTYCSPVMYRAQHLLLYHNNGDGTFTEVSAEVGLGHAVGRGMGLAVADYDGDGRPDVFIANDNDRNLLLHNLGGKFEEVGIAAGVAFNGDGRQISGMGADFRDYDGDGRPDIVMTGLRGETWELFHNRGDGTFDDASASSRLLHDSQPWSGWGCGLVDLDNDGRLDLFAACGGLDSDDPQPNRVFHNAGRDGFVDVSRSAGPALQTARLHRGIAFADFNNDGRMDAAVTALNAPVELLVNDSPRRHWLQLKLRGTRSNRSALGARVTCHTESGQQVAWVANSVGYASASDLRVHFGLGNETQALRLEIGWPSGTVQTLEKVPADQILPIEEPAQGALPLTPGSNKHKN